MQGEERKLWPGVRHVCSTCGGSGKNPPGAQVWSSPIWANEQPRFLGWSWGTDNTADIPNCLTCHGTGMLPTPDTSHA